VIRSRCYLADWLPPDFGAVGQYALQFAEEDARAGLDVVLYGFARGPSSEVRSTHGEGSLAVQRIARSNYDKTSFWQRATWTLRANFALVRAAWTDMRRCDEIVFTGSPPFLLHFIAPLKPFLRARLRYRITDFHPECLLASRGRVGLFGRILLALTWFWRKRIDLLEVLGEDQRQRLLAGGVDAARVSLRRDPSPVRFDDAVPPAEVPEQLRGRKILLYSGNFGVAHDSQTLLRAMQLSRAAGAGRWGVWLNATGARADEVRLALQAMGIPCAHTAPCALEDLPALLRSADWHLITLRDAFVGYVLPSKVYACIESGKPIVFVGSARSDVHLLCALHAAGRYRRFDVGDVTGLARFLEEGLG
jgi:hypothetical protein